MEQRREVVINFIQKNSCISKVCFFAGLNRSCFYYKNHCNTVIKSGRPIPGYTINRDEVIIFDEQIVRYLKEYRSQKEFINSGGYQKLTRYMQEEKSIYINHKKVYRLCIENNLLLDRQKKNRNYKKERCQYTEVYRPNQLWQFDIKYGYIHGEQRFFYILIFLDVFSKKVVNYHIGKSCKSGDLIFTLGEALKKENVVAEDNLIIRSDNGPQMSSSQFFYYLKRLELKLSHEFIPPRTPNRNAYVEAFNSIIEIELLSVRYFRNFVESYDAVVEFIDFYNNRRIHGSIKFMPPQKFINQFNQGEIAHLPIAV